MNKNLVLAAAVASLTIVSANADFKGEANLGVARVEIGGNHLDAYFGEAVLFTDSLVYSASAPKLEAAFLNRVGYVSARATTIDFPGSNAETYGLSYQFRKAGNANAIKLDWDRDSSASSHAFKAGYDYYLADGFTVGLAAAFDDNSFADELSFELNAKRVYSLGNEKFFTAEGAVSWSELTHDFAYEGSLNYFFNVNTGVGAFGNADEDLNTGTYGLQLIHFFSDRFSIEAAVGRSSIAGPNADNYGLNAKYRF